jgi:hypothetical protein
VGLIGGLHAQVKQKRSKKEGRGTDRPIGQRPTFTFFFLISKFIFKIGYLLTIINKYILNIPKFIINLTIIFLKLKYQVLFLGENLN